MIMLSGLVYSPQAILHFIAELKHKTVNILPESSRRTWFQSFLEEVLVINEDLSLLKLSEKIVR